MTRGCLKAVVDVQGIAIGLATPSENRTPVALPFTVQYTAADPFPFLYFPTTRFNSLSLVKEPLTEAHQQRQPQSLRNVYMRKSRRIAYDRIRRESFPAQRIRLKTRLIEPLEEFLGHGSFFAYVAGFDRFPCRQKTGVCVSASGTEAQKKEGTTREGMDLIEERDRGANSENS